MTQKEFETLKVGDKIMVYNSEHDRCDMTLISAGDSVAVITKINGRIIHFQYKDYAVACSHSYDSIRTDGGITIFSLFKTPKKKAVKEVVGEPVDKKKINLEIYRKDGKTMFKFEIDPRIEALFKGIAKEQKDSTGWNGLKFYYCPELTQDEQYKNKLYNMRLFDDFGTSLIRKNTLNIAWVRAVGGKGEIEVKEPISFSELSLLFRNATQFIKEHFEDNFKNFTIKGSLSVEI